MALQIGAPQVNAFPSVTWFDPTPPEPLSMAAVGIGLILLGITQLRPKTQK